MRLAGSMLACLLNAGNQIGVVKTDGARFESCTTVVEKQQSRPAGLSSALPVLAKVFLAFAAHPFGKGRISVQGAGIAAESHRCGGVVSRANLLNLGLTQHESKSPRVLICGDADFSYSQIVASHLKHATIFTSAYEPETELLARYPQAEDAKATLLQQGVFVQTGIDARKIAEHYGENERFDRIVFNLPQSPPKPGARNQIQNHRALLRDFCISAGAALAPSGQLWITLVAGQGGTPLDPVQRSTTDNWQIMQQAATAGLIVRDVMAADIEVLEAAGYTPTGRRGTDKQLGRKRKKSGLIVHVLVRESATGIRSNGAADMFEDLSNLKVLELREKLKAAGLKVSGIKAELISRLEDHAATLQTFPDDTEATGAEIVKGVAPLEWIIDNSFWLPAERPAPEATLVLAACKEVLEPAAVHALAELSLLDVYVHPRNNRTSCKYRCVYRSDVLALSLERSLKFNDAVCRVLSEQFSMEPRTQGGRALLGCRVSG